MSKAQPGKPEDFATVDFPAGQPTVPPLTDEQRRRLAELGAECKVALGPAHNSLRPCDRTIRIEIRDKATGRVLAERNAPDVFGQYALREIDVAIVNAKHNPYPAPPPADVGRKNDGPSKLMQRIRELEAADPDGTATHHPAPSTPRTRKGKKK